MKGIVFCGGKGVRLRPLTYYFQKTMIPIGAKQKPLLEYVIRLLKKHNVLDITLLVGYKANQIANYFEDGSRFGVKIRYLHDNPKLGGTAGALLNAFLKGTISLDETLLVYYGDILSNIDLTDLLNHHKEKKAVATIVLSTGFPVPVGVADVGEGGRITKFIEKPEIEKPVNVGILALEAETIKLVQKLFRQKQRLDLMADLIPHLIDAGERVYAYITDAFWYDMGSTEKYEKINNNTISKFLSE